MEEEGGGLKREKGEEEGEVWKNRVKFGRRR